MIRLKIFKDDDALTGAVAALLRAQMSPEPRPGACRAIMLSGGTTPLAAYRLIAATPTAVDPNVRLFFSDDRHVPPDHPASNHGAVLPMLQALGIPPRRVTRVQGELPFETAVDRYESDLRALLGDACGIPLGLLGLGADGHTASLFTPGDIARSRERLAIGVDRPDGLRGVSVTPDLLRHVGKIVFLVSGGGKRVMLRRLLRDASSLPAGLAVAGHRDVEVWADPAAGAMDG